MRPFLFKVCASAILDGNLIGRRAVQLTSLFASLAGNLVVFVLSSLSPCIYEPLLLTAQVRIHSIGTIPIACLLRMLSNERTPIGAPLCMR
jgi:hypothetical protein